MSIILGAFFLVSGIFQKPPGRLFIAARRHMRFSLILGSYRGTAWRSGAYG